MVCRPVLPKDTPDVLELTRWIWGGHDYIHLVWADWLKDTEGLLTVAEYGGHVVGLYKLTRLSPSEWWLEGLRVLYSPQNISAIRSPGCGSSSRSARRTMTSLIA